VSVPILRSLLVSTSSTPPPRACLLVPLPAWRSQAMTERDPNDPVEQMAHALGERDTCPVCHGTGVLSYDESIDESYYPLIFQYTSLACICPLCEGTGLW
jgi:hypothetical protein